MRGHSDKMDDRRIGAHAARSKKSRENADALELGRLRQVHEVLRPVARRDERRRPRAPRAARLVRRILRSHARAAVHRARARVRERGVLGLWRLWRRLVVLRVMLVRHCW